MTRTSQAVFSAMAALGFVAVVSGTGCSSSGVGDPCIPEEEYASDFLGFDDSEVNVESKSFQCLTRLCLVNHFQGRVSCPYGQNASASTALTPSSASNPNFQCDGKGAPTSQNDPCCVPGVDQPVISDQDSASCPKVGGTNVCTSVPSGTSHSVVNPQCSDRTAANAVYCSCRCANIDGQTNDGANYCTCPSGFTCSQLVSPIGNSNALLTGAYCIKQHTEYNKSTSCPSLCTPGEPSNSNQNCGGSNSANF